MVLPHAAFWSAGLPVCRSAGPHARAVLLGHSSVWVLGAGFAVVLGVELGAGWCGDDVSAGFVGVFGDGPAVGVEEGVVWFA